MVIYTDTNESEFFCRFLDGSVGHKGKPKQPKQPKKQALDK